jgi:itaconate CoA-transferase
MSYPLYYAIDDQTPPKRTGASHATIYPYGPFKAGDGKTVMLGLQNEREWKSFCDIVIQKPDLVVDARYSSNSRRVENRVELGHLIEEVFAVLTARQVIERLDEASIANAQMNDMQSVWAHDQLVARKRWTRVATPAGDIPALLPPGVSQEDASRMDPVPALGQHTDTILRELGYPEDRIQALHRTGAV